MNHESMKEPRQSEEKSMQWRTGGDAVKDQQIPGISLRLRNFRWDCGNFAGLAKISWQFSLGIRIFARHCS